MFDHVSPSNPMHFTHHYVTTVSLARLIGLSGMFTKALELLPCFAADDDDTESHHDSHTAGFIWD